MFKHALIMAAGRGSRMSPLTDVVPKALVPFNGNPLIHHGLTLIRGQIPNIYATVGYKGSLLSSYLIEYGISGVFNTNQRGNAWWIFNTLLSLLDEPLLVLTCDNIVRLEMAEIFRSYYKQGSPPCMVVPVKPVPGIDGDFIEEHDSVVVSLSRNNRSSRYCSGIQIINPQKINKLMDPVDCFSELWQNLIAKKMLHVSQYSPANWSSFDTLQQLSQTFEWI